MSTQHDAWIGRLPANPCPQHSWLPSPTFLTYLFTYLLSTLGKLDFPVSIGPRTGAGVYLHPGTICLTVSRTLILLCKPSNASLRLSSFPSYTITLSAFEVSYKTRCIDPLLLFRVMADRTPDLPSQSQYVRPLYIMAVLHFPSQCG